MVNGSKSFPSPTFVSIFIMLYGNGMFPKTPTVFLYVFTDRKEKNITINTMLGRKLNNEQNL